ncbi:MULTISPECIES: pyrimidine reductase family protein [unclassified Micromonospora]|uniref:pyrimidine reductase family protein n=1 Tax=unclassified Micromonospora TaxID=2617518 RepID=UPI00188E4DBF|nr:MULTISPECIES: pyrimidine reductase family protein [unclassified Micromonospora]MBF5033716.1 pyrimidine reductase family protein [Micromonospora sp. ANENR4]MCZ7474018.1 pyrimidine reductase family protein [Micromonospora sp. WMMC273]WBC04674.1 pyrimidine reductase family protein [Micromonospora sp. WMMA1976]
MTVGTPIERIWPAPVTGALTDPQLTALYGRAARPHLRVNFVASADGAVTLDGYSAGLSGEPDKRVFGLLRMLCDGLVVAAGTLRHEGYRAVRLSPERRAWRRQHGLAEFPTLVVVSGSLDLDPAQAAFADAPVRPIVLTQPGAEPPPGLTDVADVVRCGTGHADAPGRVDLAAGLAELRRRGLDQLLCEGGPHLFGALTAADLVDELCLTVAPLLAGAGPGRITAGDTSIPRHLPLRHVLAAGDGVLMLRYARDAAETPPAGSAPAA